ncbi:MAG TPA: hypothetical protein VKB68_01655 [Stellaceae bacterium]|nr:hypothetical protein [Stellaceae bacterium]
MRRLSLDHGHGHLRGPLAPECRTVQFSTPQSEETLRRMARLMRDRPDVELYVFGGVKDLEFLKHFEALRRLHLAVWDIDDVSGFAYLGSDFESLTFSATRKRYSLRFLETLAGLHSLFLQSHTKDLHVVGGLAGLRSIGFSGIPLADLSMLVSLRELTDVFVGFSKTRDLWALQDLPRLKNLRIIRITELAAVDILRELVGLASVELSWLRNVERLPNLSRLTSLQSVTLDTMKGLREIAGVAAAPTLQRLAVAACPSLTAASFKCLVGHPTLRELWGYTGRTRENAEIKAMFPGIAR